MSQDFFEYHIETMKEKYPTFGKYQNYHIFTLLCIKYFFYSESGISFDQDVIEEFLTDGANDGGIDAIFNDPTSEGNDLIIVQSKFYENTALGIDNVAGELYKINETLKKLQSNKISEFNDKSTHNRRERPVHGHRGESRGRFYYRITTFEGRPWDARDPYKTTFMALKHEIRLSIWRKQKETPGVEKAPGVSSPQRKESGRSGRDDGELRFWVRPGHPYKAVTSISQAEALAHGLTHLHHLVFAAVLARELDW